MQTLGKYSLECSEALQALPYVHAWLKTLSVQDAHAQTRLHSRNVVRWFSQAYLQVVQHAPNQNKNNEPSTRKIPRRGDLSSRSSLLDSILLSSQQDQYDCLCLETALVNEIDRFCEMLQNLASQRCTIDFNDPNAPGLTEQTLSVGIAHLFMNKLYSNYHTSLVKNCLYSPQGQRMKKKDFIHYLQSSAEHLPRQRFLLLEHQSLQDLCQSIYGPGTQLNSQLFKELEKEYRRMVKMEKDEHVASRICRTNFKRIKDPILSYHKKLFDYLTEKTKRCTAGPAQGNRSCYTNGFKSKKPRNHGNCNNNSTSNCTSNGARYSQNRQSMDGFYTTEQSNNTFCEPEDTLQHSDLGPSDYKAGSALRQEQDCESIDYEQNSVRDRTCSKSKSMSSNDTSATEKFLWKQEKRMHGLCIPLDRNHSQLSTSSNCPEQKRYTRLGRLLQEVAQKLTQRANKNYYNRYQAYERVQKQMAKHNLAAILFGSSYNGLATERSDVDVAIECSILTFFPGNCLKDRISQALSYVEKLFQSQEWVVDHKLIGSATIPVLKLIIKTESPELEYEKQNRCPSKPVLVEVDITVDTNGTGEGSTVHMGLMSTQLMSTWLAQYPCLHTIILILKQVFWKHGFNSPYKGGLSAYSLSVMVVAYILHRMPCQLSLSETFFGFMEFYGCNFDESKQGIDVRDARCPFYSNKSFADGRLEVKDPLDGKVMTRNSLMYRDIKNLFARISSKIRQLQQEELGSEEECFDMIQGKAALKEISACEESLTSLLLGEESIQVSTQKSAVAISKKEVSVPKEEQTHSKESKSTTVISTQLSNAQ